MDLREERIYYDANKFWGEKVVNETIECCLDLINTLFKWKINEKSPSSVEERLAATLLSCERLTLIFDPEQVEGWKERKLNLLDSKVKKEQDRQNIGICVHPTGINGG